MDVMAPQYCSQSTQNVCSMPAILDRSSGKLEEALSTAFRPCSSELVCDFLYSVGVHNKKRGIQRFNKDGCHTKRFSLTPFTLCVPWSGLCWNLAGLEPANFPTRRDGLPTRQARQASRPCRRSLLSCFKQNGQPH